MRDSFLGTTDARAFTAAHHAGLSTGVIGSKVSTVELWLI
jgi:hypothetical protein